MIWLASYPRSGNTFFRIVLREVYGIESSEFHDPKLQGERRDHLDYPVVKTHLLPGQLIPDDPSIPAVYLVRDGRDAVVSMARQRRDVSVPGSDFRLNLLWITAALPGKVFGGWSRHVREWRRRASVVIRFEDLIADPIGCVERIRPIFPLPEPRTRAVPTFEELKAKEHDFGPGDVVMQSATFRQQFFRRGKVGAWKDEMPTAARWLFHLRHGKVLREMGYAKAA
jgi:hypothetical protein